jgi:hypothetical protein
MTISSYQNFRQVGALLSTNRSGAVSNGWSNKYGGIPAQQNIGVRFALPL